MKRLNYATEEGRELGRYVAGLCDKQLNGKPDNRCATCAFREGEVRTGERPILLSRA